MVVLSPGWIQTEQVTQQVHTPMSGVSGLGHFQGGNERTVYISHQGSL